MAISHARRQIFISQIYNSVFFISIFILYTTSGRKASQFRMMFPELMRCCGFSVDSVRLKRGKKDVTHRKRDRGEEWQSGRTATGKNDASFDDKKTLIKEGSHNVQRNRR